MTPDQPRQIKKRWDVYPRLTQEVSENLKDYPLLIRQILSNRGITNLRVAKEYMLALSANESDPFTLCGMQKAVDRILMSIANREKIVVYGDYDVDGVTATVLMVEALTDLGANVSPYIPDRFEEGYGINIAALDSLKNDGIALVISVDSGVRSIPEAEHCREIGLDLIITDHHTPLDEIPVAVAVIDPKVPGEEYPYRDSAGVGVAYKLAKALYSKTGRMAEMGERWLDLVAIGTVADLAPLTGENRFLVRKGLEIIQSRPSLGILHLCKAAGINYQKVDSTTIGFGIGPRLNAAGRMENALFSYDLLSAKNEITAAELARKLDSQNRDRQEETRRVVDSAMRMVEELGETSDITFAIADDFSEGIVGLAASRLVEHYYRPAIVGRRDLEKGTIRCSCRSIPEFNITSALDECADLMDHHGGHAAAAGLTVQIDKFDELKRKMQEVARREFSGINLTPVLIADAEVKLSDLSPELYGYLRNFQPIGYSNPEPAFITRGLKIMQIRTVGQEGKHLRMQLSDGWLSINAIAFNKGGMKDALMERKQADFIYVYEPNEFNGRVDFQLNVKDIHIE